MQLQVTKWGGINFGCLTVIQLRQQWIQNIALSISSHCRVQEKEHKKHTSQQKKIIIQPKLWQDGTKLETKKHRCIKL
jgi:hypothetical protein